MTEPETARRAGAIAIFALTYAVMALGRLPGFRLDRAGAAFLGATLMVAAGALSLPEAYRAIDMNTITLLFGMMIVVANLRLSGFFRVLTAWAAMRMQHPLLLLGAVVLLAGVLSAFLVNDAVCLALTPLVLDLTQHLERNPVPYLLAVAMAANIGGVATITGNPQNMIIGNLSGIGYGHFAAALAPVAAAGLVLATLLIALVWRGEFWTAGRLAMNVPPPRPNRALMLKSLLVTAALMVAFFAGVIPAKAAALAGALLLLSPGVKIRKVYADIDWTLLLMFSGLFVVVAGFERMVITPSVLASLEGVHLASVPVLSVVAAVLSNVVSNVPAVLVLAPFVQHLPDPHRAWLVLAMASTLAGNFTIVGSVANLIVVQWARLRHVEIGFGAYFAVGAPLTVLTIALGVALL